MTDFVMAGGYAIIISVIFMAAILITEWVFALSDRREKKRRDAEGAYEYRKQKEAERAEYNRRITIETANQFFDEQE